MKRLLISSLIVLFLVGAGIAVVKDITSHRGGDLAMQMSDVATSTTPASTTPIAAASDALRRRALTLIKRPLIRGAEELPAAIQADLEHQIKDLNASITADYNNMNLWISLGLARKALGDYEGAAEAWEFAGVLRPKNALSFANLGFLYGSYLKEYARGEKNYLTAIAHDPQGIVAYMNLADLYWYSMPEKHSAIPGLLNDGVRKAALNDQKIALLSRLASYYEDNKDPDNAIATLEEGLRLVPGQPQFTAALKELKATTGATTGAQ